MSLLLVGSGCGPKNQVRWEKYTPETLQAARQSGQPIAAYFYAAWCPKCYQLKEVTFSDLRVIEALAGFRKIKIDMSFQHSPNIRKIAREFRIQGFPTVLFFDRQGRPAYQFQVSGFRGPDEFLEVVQGFTRAQAESIEPPQTVTAGTSESTA